MKYEAPRVLTKEEAEDVFATGTPHDICGALVSAALNEEDWSWVQEKCLAFAAHEESSVRAIAATCLGHVARIHRKLDLNRVLPALETLRKDPATSGYAETALDDIGMYIRD